MSEIFLKIINMSISASYIVLAVLLLRLLLRKAPKWITVLLWGIVAIRLVCPFSVESVLSLIPSAEVISPNIMTDKTPTINTGIQIINSALNPVISDSFTPNPVDSANPLQIWIPVLTTIWIVVMVALLIYTVISYARVRRKIGTAVLYKDNIYQSENVVSPFVIGIIKPKIYLPFNINEKDMEHVVAHEMAHIRRKDHLWKPRGFLLLTLHWFNPLMWFGYVLLCRDIELACDEKVIGELDRDARADYSEALLTCSVNRRLIAACPLAFGEVGVQQRIKSVLNYKKPAFWIIILAVIACAVTAVCFLTNPLTIRNPWVQEYEVGAKGILGQVDKAKYESVSADFAVGADKYGRTVFKDPFAAFETMTELYSEGLTLIAEEQELAPISQRNYNLYKKFGWQVTSGSEQAQEQARFVSSFLDIYENSFDKQKPNIDLPEPTAEEKTSLTLEDVITLSAKGYDLTWEDFSAYPHTDIGSGLFIWELPIDEMFSVRVGGGSLNVAPMYVYLYVKSGDLEEFIDIRDGDVDEYIASFAAVNGIYSEQWNDGISFVGLGPKEEILSTFEIILHAPYTTIKCTIGHAPLGLKLSYGLVDSNGKEYILEVVGGTGKGTFEDIPAGTYRLFVRNSDYSGVPAYENPAEYPDVSFDATGVLLYKVE